MKKSIRARCRIAQYNDNICSVLEQSISLSLKRCEDISKEIIKSTDNGEKKELNNSLEGIESILVSQQESYKVWVEQKNHEELKIYPWEHMMRYDRGVDGTGLLAFILQSKDAQPYHNLLEL